ncbi:hypothetical protein [Chroococcidiopsis sp. CCALA 051]|nr:hypothetical protein [Chroococcidiopsis sp. CCALA 051]
MSVVSCRLSVTRPKHLATSHQLPITNYQLPITNKIILQYVDENSR